METIKTFRKRNKISQVALAEYLNVTQGFISQMENGTSAIPDAIISKILANEFGWDVSMLTESQPKDAVESQPEEVVLIDKLFALVEDQRAEIKMLLSMLGEKDAKIDELRRELDARKGGSANNVARSSSADVV